MFEELTPEQKEMARQARNAYQRSRNDALRKTRERYWYRKALKQLEEEADNAKDKAITE